MAAKLDHVVVGASDLEAGAVWMADRLGLAAQGGGVHAGAGTWNRLWRLGEAYLELIAPDPGQPAPPHPRLFGLDRAEVAAPLAGAPRVIAWVAAVEDLDATLAAAPAGFAPARAMRRGALSWRLATAEPPLWGGAFPGLIDWGDSPHPAQAMAENGARLAGFSLRSAQSGPLETALERAGVSGIVTIGAGAETAFEVEIDCPAGRVTLS